MIQQADTTFIRQGIRVSLLNRTKIIPIKKGVTKSACVEGNAALMVKAQYNVQYNLLKNVIFCHHPDEKMTGSLTASNLITFRLSVS